MCASDRGRKIALQSRRLRERRGFSPWTSQFHIVESVPNNPLSRDRNSCWYSPQEAPLRNDRFTRGGLADGAVMH